MRSKVFVEGGTHELPNIYIATLLKNIENLGYTLAKDLLCVIKTLTPTDFEQFYFELVEALKSAIGANAIYKPMYPNFPKQVMGMDEYELYSNAIMHYLSFGTLLPEYEKDERFPLLDLTKLKVIALGNEHEFMHIFTHLVNAKTSISEIDKKTLEWFIAYYGRDIVDYLPDKITLKENIALVSKLLLEHEIFSQKQLFKYFNTSTDVLRLAVCLSDGDISLATNTRFRSFKRAERRLLLALLEQCNHIEEDMITYKGQWIRLGERIHPGEYYKKYPNTYKSFQILRDNKKIETFNSKVEKALLYNNSEHAVHLLKRKPGEFARRLDHLLRISHTDCHMILSKFKNVANQVSSTVLLQVMAHFKNRNTHSDIRVFFPKGNVGKAYSIPNELPDIDQTTCQEVVKICEGVLINKYMEKDTLGHVYIDKRLKNYIVPFSQRSANKSLKTIVRGSKIHLHEAAKTIRSFIYWKEAKDSTTDIDLSAVMYDSKWHYIEHISYTHLKSDTYKACHSGDIVSAPHGASEFIDLDIESVRQYGGRYIVLSVNSFSQHKLSELPECFMGWMTRECPNSGEIYEPKTVQNKIDITSQTLISIPIIIDVIDNKIIWTDLSLTHHPFWCNNIEGNQKGMILIGKAMTNFAKPSLYDLFMLHAMARGKLCYNIDEADTIFSIDRGVTPFDNDIIISEYL
ncbi:TerD family protein [Vallitalea pronyensis]|nr:TerD family protein [Vallitalea pronyensis]